MSTSQKKLLGLLVLPVAVAVAGGGVLVVTSHQANAHSSQPTQAVVDTPEPGDTPDKPGEKEQPEAQEQQEQGEQNEQNEQGEQKGVDTKD